MLKMFTYVLILSSTLNLYSQQKKVYYSDAISQHLKKYNFSCKEATLNKDFNRLDFLFDSLVKYHLKGTFFENMNLKKLPKGKIQTDSIKNPFFIFTTSSWFFKSDEEIEAINNLAEQFKGEIDIIVLFWDTQMNTKKSSKKYNKSVLVTYIDEGLNTNNNQINTYKHALGFPTSFYIAKDKKIVNISRGGLYSTKENSNKSLYALNYDIYVSNMVKLLLHDDLNGNTMLTDTD